MDLLIFVTLGTQDKQFKRLLEAVDKLDINDKIIAQTGSTEFKSDKVEIHKYLSQRKFNQYMKDADMIITHAGVGTIIAGLKLHKKMIVAARRAEYKEHVNNHQMQILEAFSKDGYILPLYDFEDLPKLIKTEFIPKEFMSNNKIFNKKSNSKIDELVSKR